MADNSALLASLLLGQKQRPDPIEAQRKYGQDLIIKGSSTAPLGSGNPLEGIARALQGALGGLTAGYADQLAQERGQKTVSGLSAALQANTPEDAAKALQGAGGDPETVAASLAQLLSQKGERYNKNALATNAYTAAGGTAPGASLPAAAPPLPQGDLAPGAFANNTGNIRATNLPWEGKGAPQNGFETFNTPQAGVNAHLGNLASYAQANPNITVAQAIQKWAPPNENNTQQYISQVAEGTGINPGMPLAEVLKDPAMGAQLLDAMTRKEKGGLPQGVNADTFMNATGGGGQPGPLQINMQARPPQGSADGVGVPQQPQASPQTPSQPQVSPAAAELMKQAQVAYQGGDAPRAAALQQKAQETQAAFLGEIDKEQRAQGMKQPQENITNEGKLRDDFNGLQPVKDYRKAATVFRSAVEAAKQDSKASDLNMVYAFATLMDPGSVVRDQESNMVIATAGASDRIKGLVNGLTGNSTLGPRVKEALLNEMGSRYEAYKVGHDDLAKTFTGITTRSGGNPQNVITPFPEVPYTKAGPSAAGADLRKKYGLE